MGERGCLLHYISYNDDSSQRRINTNQIKIRLIGGQCEEYTIYMEPIWNYYETSLVMLFYDDRYGVYKEEIFHPGVKVNETEIYKGKVCGFDLYFFNGMIYTLAENSELVQRSRL